MTADTREALDEAMQALAVAGGFSNHVSQLLTGKPTDKAGKLASMVHAKMCAHARSLGALYESTMFDHSAMMSIGRMMIDAMAMFFYLIEHVSQDEGELRWSVLLLHDTTARILLVRACKEKSTYEALINGAEYLRQQIRSNPKFSDYSPETKVRLLSGQEMFIGRMRAAAGRAGWGKDTFKAIYNYFSAHIHSAPMSYVRMREYSFDVYEPSEMQLGPACMATAFARACLLRVTLRYLQTDPDSARELHQEVLSAFIEEDRTTRIFTSGN